MFFFYYNIVFIQSSSCILTRFQSSSLLEKVLSFDQQALHRGAHMANSRTAQSCFQKESECRCSLTSRSTHRVKDVLLKASTWECEAHINGHITACCRHFAQTLIWKSLNFKELEANCARTHTTDIQQGPYKAEFTLQVQVTQFHFFFFFCMDAKFATFWTFPQE